MSTVIQADVERLRLASEAMQSFHRTLTESHQDVMRMAWTFLNALYAGNAQAAFRDVLATFDPSINRVGEQFQDVASRLHALRERLLEVDAAGASAGTFTPPNPDFDDVDGVGDDVSYKYIDGQPFIAAPGEPDIHESDVNQGAIGDCYFVAPLAAMARTERGRQILRDMIRENPDGTYTVKFYETGGFLGLGGRDPVEVIVTPEFPMNKDKTPVFAGFGDRAGGEVELWTMLIEKAYAKYYGGDYEEIVGGFAYDAFEELTGIESTVVAAQDIEFEALAQHFENGDAMTVSTFSPWPLIPDITDRESRYTSKELVKAHEYYITEVNRADQTVTIRNPWGYHLAPLTYSFDDFKTLFNDVSINPLQ